MGRDGRRLSSSGWYRKEPVFIPAESKHVERNRPCPCGSGKKYKKCCGNPTHHRPFFIIRLMKRLREVFSNKSEPEADSKK
ncbi:MAG: SEC-C domain-containing protein [Candidatus Omnitrophica bacterium]|nr:SEC-C domain-containing protein [Candidatus Omnitrophota bacterium]